MTLHSPTLQFFTSTRTHVQYYSEQNSCLISLQQSHPSPKMPMLKDPYVKTKIHHLAEYLSIAVILILIFAFASVPQNIVHFHPSLCQTANGLPSLYWSLRGGCPLICAMQATFQKENVSLLIFIQGNQSLVDPMDSDQKWTYFRMLVDLVG